MDETLKPLVRDAQRGNRTALESLVRAVQDQVYHLAMRMLANPEDAREASQEILILVVTKLSTFRGDSAFRTWVYRVATNYLLTARKVADRDQGLTFGMFGADLEDGLAADPAPAADDLVLLNELRISCTMAMLLCLDLKHRIAYVLGDILELGHAEAAEVLTISKDNFRKRLSRARRDIVAFTSARCGLANSTAKCSCPGRLPAALAQGRVHSDAIAFSVDGAPSYDTVASKVKQVEGDLKTLTLQSATASYACPQDLAVHIADIVQDPV